MSTCSATEIAEKKRLALEKLRAKKAALHDKMDAKSIAQGTRGSNVSSGSNVTSMPIAELQDKKSSSFYNSAAAPASASHSGAASTSKNTGKYKSTPAVQSTSASEFLNALKQCTEFKDRIRAPAAEQRSEPHSPPEARAKIPRLALSPPKQLAPIFTQSITCSVYLVSAVRFAIRTSGFHGKLIDTFKSIPSKAYDKHTRIWTFGLCDYKLLHQRVSSMKPDVIVGNIPKSVLNLCMAPPPDIKPLCLMSIEPTLADKLMPFQQEGVCFAIAQRGRIMICDEMGLGKTYQALAVADFYKDSWPLFICTTASTRESWLTHVRELLPNIPLHSVQVLTNNQQYFGDAKVLVTSYNMMEKHYAKLQEHKFGFLIFDESHMLKNSKAKCTNVAERLSSQAKHVVLLSGTPALSRPLELFTQLQMIDRHFMSFMDFTSRYCDGKQTHFGWDASGQSNLDELNVVLKLKFMIRRTKADVLPQLASKSRETVVLDPALLWTNESTAESLNAFAKHLSASKGREREEILLNFYSRTAEVKTAAVCSYLKSLVKENIKFIVFAHHRVMMDAICDCLYKSNVHFVRIDGSTRNETRGEYIEAFQKKSSCKVAVLSLKACNSGITLTAAEMIIFAELDWNPSTLAQAESRAHRIGQLRPVICRYLMANKTADDVIWNMLKTKQDILKKAGLFCENLQEATHTSAPTISNSILKYYSPNKPNKTPLRESLDIKNIVDTKMKSDDSQVDPAKGSLDTKLKCSEDTVVPKSPPLNIKTDIDLSKELQNIDELFQDDDDDAFENLHF